MDVKPRPNHQLYLETLRALTPEQRLQKVLELGDLSRALFRDGLRHRFPDATESQLHDVYLRRLEKCHNRTS
jgi:hypothetical protein